MTNSSRLNSGSACCHVVWNTLFCVVLLENVVFKVCKCDSFLVVLYGCESWCVTSNVAHRLRVFENRGLG